MVSTRKRTTSAQSMGRPHSGAASLGENPRDIPVGVVGLGLMGTSISACLLAAGHPVVAVTKDLTQAGRTRRPGVDLLRGMKRENLLSGDPGQIANKLLLSENFSALSDCQVVIESVVEQLAVKQEVFRKIEAVVSPE